MLQLIELAKRLPSGIPDPLALTKIAREAAELHAAASRIDKVTEGCDIVYYAAKAWASDLMTLQQAMQYLGHVAWFLNMNEVAVTECALIKYSLRAAPGNPKRPDVERAAVAAFLDGLYGKDKW